jgi:indole-3-acetate monooxygenase
MSAIEGARALVPELAARAAEAEARRTMPADLVAAARRAGLFRMAVPRSLGGLELDPVSIIEMVELVSAADGSAGWTVLIGNSATFAAWLDPVVARRLLGADADVVSTGVFSALGRAVPEPDSDHVVVDGRWPFNSGCVHADWFQVGVLVMDGDEPARRPDGRPDWRFAWVPRADGEVIDTWRSTGLRGTGSHDVAVRGARIPLAHTAMPMFDPPRAAGPLLGLGFRALTGALLAGFPLGVARRALDEIVARAPTKRRWGRDATVAEDGHAQHLIGRAEAALLAARALVIEAYGAAWATITAGSPATDGQRSRMLLATQQAMQAAVGAVDVAHDLVGSSAVDQDHPVGRCFRDLHAARLHVVFSGEAFAEYARQRFAAPAPVADPAARAA